MLHPCPNVIGCPGSDFPITNYSSEDPDREIFIGISWGSDYTWFPPLNPDWNDPDNPGGGGNPDCQVISVNYASQENAGLCAIAVQVLCGNGQIGEDTFVWPCAPENGGDGIEHNDPDPPVRPPGPHMYGNALTECRAPCPGSPETFTVFTVFPNTFFGRSQIEADRMAQSYCTLRVSKIRLCFGPLQENACLGILYDQVLLTQSGVGVHGPVSFTITGGSLPPGIVLSSAEPAFHNAASLFGTPTSAGNYVFTITATPAVGVAISKMFTISVLGIDNAGALPGAIVGVPYSEALTVSGGSGPYTFSVPPLGLPLPGWLSISPAGLLTGTPTDTDIGIVDFDVTVTDADGQFCTDMCTVSVIQGCDPDTNCNAPQQAPCVFPASITFTDWNFRKTQIVAPTADPALGQTEWDGTLPVADDVDFPGVVRWYPAGTAFPVVVARSFNNLLGFPGGIRLDVSGGSWRLVMYGYVLGVPTLIWQGNKTAGVTPEGTYVRVGGLSAGPDCMHATVTTIPAALAWWTMDGPNPLINTDAACGLQLTVPSGVLPDYSIVAGHVVNATQINCGSSVPGSVTDDLLECSNAALKFNGVGTTICGWINVSDTVPDVDNGVIVDYLFDQNGVPYQIRIERHGSGANWIASINGLGSIAIASAAGWHFLVVTFDAVSGNLGFDIDQSGMTTAFAVIPSVGTNVNGDFTLSIHTEVGKVVNVIFDELAIFDGVLTTAQLNCIYNAGVGKTW